MIDIHTHILPGIDDGSKDAKESISLLRQEASQGIREVVLTPHFYADQNSISKFLERRARAWGRLQPHLQKGLPRLRLGAEVQYFEGICAADDLEALRIEGTDLLLLEMPFSNWTERMIEDVLELNSRDNIQILLAHIERYIPFQTQDPFPKLAEAGVLFQSNLSMFLHWNTRRQGLNMLNQGMIQVFGSDCHSVAHRPPMWEKLPEKVFDRAERLNLLFEAKWLTQETPIPEFRD